MAGPTASGNSKGPLIDPGLCRCCRSIKKCRVLSAEYEWTGQKEIYSEMFMDCFGLLLSNLDGDSKECCICATCVGRLREACAFRHQVLQCEQALINLLQSKEEDKNLWQVDVKMEPSCADSDAPVDQETADHSPDGTDTDYDVRMNSCAISLLNAHSPSPRPPPSGEKAGHAHNADTLIRYSSMTPFKSKRRSGYPCFYCHHVFEQFQLLKDHTKLHCYSELTRVFKEFGPESLIVYADVSDLKCNICSQSVLSVNELKTHLVNKHGKKIIPNVTDRVIPYIINGDMFVCQICSCRFATFGSIERHMNGHYRNYVCMECGSGYVTKYRLNVHHKSMHIDGKFACTVCGKVFTTQQKHKNHVDAVHKLKKRFKCTKCNERFAEYFRRQKHMVEVHGLAPLKYTCNVCDRSFDRRSSLSRHLKRDHLEERENECDICNYRCYTKNELKIHMVKHTGERIFECAVCKKSYTRQKTLKEHMKIHNNDRRFVCPACGQAFVQKCSLKGHMKTHHTNTN